MSAAACDTWIWGNKLQGSVAAAKDLLMSGEIDKTTKAGESWLSELNKVVGSATDAIDTLLANLPVSP